MYFPPITPAGRARQKLARTLYAQCVDQARVPEFYIHMDVPDTFNGRFELTALHTGMVVARLADPAMGKESEKLAQALFDDMFINMDRTIREIGVGDLSVPKHIKRMMKALKGRALTYTEAISAGSAELQEALARNLYGTIERPPADVLAAAADYVINLQSQLAAQDYAGFSAGRITFPQPTFRRAAHGEESKAA